MKRLSLLAIVVLLFAVSSTSIGQNQDRTKREVNRIRFQLLPGYRVSVSYGLDTWGAKIWKDGGVTIEFVNGLHVGVEADSVEKGGVTWREEQFVNSQRFICVYRKANDLVVSIAQLAVNFRGHIRNQQDLAEMLLIVLTYEPTHGYRFEPGTVVIPSPEDSR